MKDIVLVDKPAGWTSFDVVAKIRGQIRAEYQRRGITPTKKQLKVGHAGTLDPFATGLLIVLLGDACKKSGEFLKLDKTYEFTAKLGEMSTTGDPEGDIEAVSDTKPTQKTVLEALKQFVGVISQTPPAYSAIKIDGKRAYKMAREGKAVDIPTRSVTIYSLKLLEYNYPYLKCECKVSSGTYIRSLVEDIGKILATGAYCSDLRRISIDTYQVSGASAVENVAISV